MYKCICCCVDKCASAHWSILFSVWSAEYSLVFPLELPSNGHGRSSRGISFPLLAQAANLLPKSAHPSKPILDLERPAGIPLPYCYLWDCCCVSFQPAIGTHNTQETNLFCSQQRLHGAETSWCIFHWFWGTSEPGTVLKECLRSACPAEILPSRVAQSHLPQPWERFHRATFLLSAPRKLLLSEELGVVTNPGVRLGADVFLQFSSESFLFCSFFCQCWSYSFSVHAKLPQREKQISW